ncbi:DUF1206 domain-containing protein [Microbacterium sp. GXF7504]
MDNAAADAMREARAQPWARRVARAGYAATGVVHALIGSIIIAVAAGDEADSGHTGAFRAIAEVPFGFVLLWILTACLAALGLWHASSALVVHGRDRATWGIRFSEAGQAVAFLTLGGLAAAIALGARPQSERTAHDASRNLLSLPGGPWLLGAVGLGIGVAGIVFVAIGVRRGFRKVMDLPGGAVGRTVTVLGVVGYTAKGAALLIIAVLLAVAAVTLDPDAAGGLDGAVHALRGMLLGPVLVGLVGAGFVAYGVFCGARTRYARMERRGGAGKTTQAR